MKQTQSGQGPGGRGQRLGPRGKRLTASPGSRGDDTATNQPAASNKANLATGQMEDNGCGDKELRRTG